MTMFLNEFDQTPKSKVTKMNKILGEQFGIQVKPGAVSLRKLTKINETAKQALYKIRGSQKKFQLEPDYAKFLGLKDLTDIMIKEGYYPESDGYRTLEAKIAERVKHLMNCGYTTEEACSQCMNEVRMDASHCYEDGVTKPMVMAAVKSYESSCGMSEDAIAEAPTTDLGDRLLAELAREVGVELEGLESYDTIEEKLEQFAEVAGKSRDAVVGFLNGLEEDALTAGIQMFGRKIAEQNKFTGARQAAIVQGKKEFEVDGVTYDVTGDKVQSKQPKKESMFDDVIADLITEEVDVEQAEVVMAVRALADDIQGQIERISDMMNKDIPAISDQMRAEMGASQAQAFSDSTAGLLQGHLEACKSVKAGLDQQVASLSGDEMAGGLGDTGELGGDDMGGDELGGMEADPLAEPDLDNIPADQGADDEPLGRAEI
jgi:hypothetical protein